MPVFQQHASPPGVSCSVGGTLVVKESAHSKTAWFSVVRRQVDEVMDWNFRSPAPTLLWMRHGFRRFTLEFDGKIEKVDHLAGPAMVLVPAGVTLNGNFGVAGEAGFTVVFFMPGSLMDQASEIVLVDPLVNFRHRELEHSLVDMSREVARPDNLFDMLAEGWAMQALAHMSRKGHYGSSEQRSRNVGGLSRTNRSRVEEYIRAHFSNAITLDDLARVTGLTIRHVSRAFRASFSETPMRYVVRLRIETAARMLIQTRAPITQIALDCGFSHAQHFSASFSKAVGCSPSEFRRRGS